MANVTELLNHIKQVGGLARANRFRVSISLPELVLTALGENSIKLPEKVVSIMCQSVSNTGVNIAFQDITTLGTSSRKMPYNRHSNSDLELVFLCSEGLLEQTIFETWARTVVGSNYTTEFFDDIVSDITVEHLDVADNVTKTVSYCECYPQVVGVISEDKTATDTMLTLSVTFSTTKKSSNTTDTAARSAGKQTGIKFGKNAKTFKSSPLTLMAAAPGYLITSNYTSDIVKKAEVIKKSVLQNSMNVQMANFLFKNLVVSVGRMQGVPSLYKDGISAYLNDIISTLNK